ncbi:MAG: hypothetical protein GY789_00275 [Hyphomicrobiales bacterium]|nr:hypothetical protein [Hyphomicrobiales bacterium]MCP4999642.1 hypothetical protein [Hyphomicrobiales bacterium]
MNDDASYHWNKKPSKTYVSRQIRNREDERPIRIASKVIDVEGGYAYLDVAMSEWYNNHRKSKGTARVKLQELIAKSRIKRNCLTDKELQRLSKLEGILSKLQNSEHVQNRQLKRWLTEDEFSQIEALWEEQKFFREDDFFSGHTRFRNISWWDTLRFDRPDLNTVFRAGACVEQCLMSKFAKGWKIAV